MKKNTAYTIGSLIILLICAFCFVVLPAFTGASDANKEKLPAFGKFKGKEIKYEQGNDYYNFVSQYGQSFQNRGQQIDSSAYYYIFSYAFNATVRKMYYEDAVKSSGYVAPKSSINKQLITYFSDGDGKYSSKLYRETDEATKKEIRRGVEDNLYTTRFYDDTFGSESAVVGKEGLFGIKESDSELDFLTNYGNNKRAFNMAVFSMNNYPEEETINFGKKNAAKFNKFDLSLITVDTKSTAENLLKRIENNEITFEDAVSDEYSTKAFSNTEGKITNSYQYQIENILTNKDDIATLSNLTTGALSPVIETGDSFSIFKKDADTVSPDFSNADTISFVATYMKNYESSIIEDYFSAKATDFTREAMLRNFQKAAEADESVEFVEIPAFPLNYGSVNITQSVNTSLSGLSNADVNENFLSKAFALKENEISEPIVMNNSVIVLQYIKNAEETDNANPVTISDLAVYDENSSETAIMASDKLENNFANVYFNYLMSN